MRTGVLFSAVPLLVGTLLFLVTLDNESPEVLAIHAFAQYPLGIGFLGLVCVYMFYGVIWAIHLIDARA